MAYKKKEKVEKEIYPMRLTSEQKIDIRIYNAQTNTTIKEFISEAIDEKLARIKELEEQANLKKP